jgi:hypothetical protein
VAHGGSRFEEIDWLTKPTRFRLMGQLKFMIPEVLFLKGLYEFNRKLWYRSFPFHFGLYLLGGTRGRGWPENMGAGCYQQASAGGKEVKGKIKLSDMSRAGKNPLVRLENEDLKPLPRPGSLSCLFMGNRL